METSLVKKIITAVALGILVIHQGVAIAETGADTVDATAGLQSVMTLTCTPVNLGVWRTPPRTTGGVTEVVLDIDKPKDGYKVLFNTKIARALGYQDWAPDHGVCTITDSRALKRTSAKVNIINNRYLSVVPVSDRHTNVKAGRSKFGIRVDVQAPRLVPIMDGSASFLIGGAMTIPEKIETGDYGGYVTSVHSYITVDDGMPN